MENRNIFECNKEFFIIESNNLKDIQTELYGYTIIDNTLIEHKDFLFGNDPTGDGPMFM